MARKRKRRSGLNGIVIMLVALVVVFCIFTTLAERDDLGLELPEIGIPSLGMIQDYIDELTGSGGKSHMDNAMYVSAPVAGEGVTVYMQDMGQADSILIRGPERTVLIDAGENGQGEQVLRFLEAQGITQIDVAIGTHPHSDHIGGLDTVVLGIPVKEVILPEIPADIVPTTATYTDLLEAIEQREVPVTIAEPGMRIELGDGAVMTILGPLNPYNDLNAISVVTRLDYGGTSFLFTGDTIARSEADMVAQGGLSADVLQAPHHGSNTSSSREFAEAVNPKAVLISCGLNNSYGHPHRETLETYLALGPDLYRTDLMGTITVYSDGNDLYITTEKGE